jgi:hypothetical protein
MSAGAKSDRSMSPNAVSEDERREILARQHRALYGDDSSLYSPQPGSASGDGPSSGRQSQDARVPPGSGSGRGHSPLAYAPFGMPTAGGATPTSAGPSDPSSAVQMPPRDKADGNERSRANSTSPSTNQQGFSPFESGAPQHSSRTSTSSPGGAGSPPNAPGYNKQTVAPIGTRPAGSGASGQAPGNPALAKRSTTPLPSPLSFGMNASEQSASNGAQAQNGQASSSNPPSAVPEKGNSGIGWGSGSGVWGTGKGLGVQASVWG